MSILIDCHQVTTLRNTLNPPRHASHLLQPARIYDSQPETFQRDEMDRPGRRVEFIFLRMPVPGECNDLRDAHSSHYMEMLWVLVSFFSKAVFYFRHHHRRGDTGPKLWHLKWTEDKLRPRARIARKLRAATKFVRTCQSALPEPE